MERLENLLRHVSHVRENCELLGERLIARGDAAIGLQLIANGHIHDNSKFYGLEWEYLNDGAWPYDDDSKKELFAAALKQHVVTNPHHPEYWPGGIKSMPPLYLAEMVCDWHARSSEQGTDLCEWARGKAPKRFGFSKRSRIAIEIKEFLDLLLERKFK